MKRHITLWLAYLSFILLYAYFTTNKENPLDLPAFFFSQFLLILVFYHNYFIVQPTYFEKNKVLGICFFILGLASYFLVRYLFAFKISPLLGRPTFDSPVLRSFLATHTYLYVLYSVYALAFWYFKKSIKVEQQLRITETEMLGVKNKSLESENERIKADYNTLKSQINPHFLYNTLNFFYANVYEQHPQTANGIALLSDIMRYSLSPGDEQGRVPLFMEWEHMENFIELNQMRYEEPLPVSLKMEGDTAGVSIMPHLLITLVENVFKHGDMDKPIHIHLKVCEGQFNFTVQNHIPAIKRNINEGSGMGLANVKRRLWHEYHAQAVFDVRTTGDLFTVEVKLPVSYNKQRAA
jgi:two-component system, LytTR family, sensor kinase